MSVAEALTAPLAPSSTLYLGKPCAKGHRGMRFLSNRSCVECHRQERRDARAKGRTREGMNAEEFEAAVLMALYPEEFERTGCRHIRAARYE
jgi:hypothetical protein